MKIDNFDTTKKVMIIAEIGNNHEGNYALAEEMICKAAEAGVDAVKFQTIVPERLVSAQDQKRIGQLRKFQFSIFEFKNLSLLAKKEGVIFLTTPFDIESVPKVNEFVPAFKIASSDNNFYPLIKEIVRTGKPIIMSAGLIFGDELRMSIDFIKERWASLSIKSDLALLHCVSLYPVPFKEANLKSILYFKEKFPELTIGYSDHTLGIDTCVYSVALGSRIVEKHFTTDKNYSTFRDHQLSADPKEMRELVVKVRELESILGKKSKEVSPEEDNNRLALRRSAAAKTDLLKGHIISADDIFWLRPGEGFLVGQESEVIGKKLKKNVKFGFLFKEEDIE